MTDNKTKQTKSINVNELVDKKTVKENLNKPLANIYGVATTSFSHTTKYGENTGFKGDFFGVNLITGEVLESSAAFLPKQITEQIIKQLETNQGGEVHFSCTLKALESDKSPSGYAWIADEIDSEACANRRAALLKIALADMPKQIAAPKKADPKKAA